MDAVLFVQLLSKQLSEHDSVSRCFMFSILAVPNDVVRLTGIVNKPKRKASACHINPVIVLVLDHRGPTVFSIVRKPLVIV